MPKKLISLEEAKDKILGKIGTKSRDKYELELKNALDDLTTTNFYQVVDQTHAEIVAMYMKATKKELISMLIECNKQLDLVLTSPFCPHCHKYKKMQGNGIMHQLCECGLTAP